MTIKFKARLVSIRHCLKAKIECGCKMSERCQAHCTPIMQPSGAAMERWHSKFRNKVTY